MPTTTVSPEHVENMNVDKEKAALAREKAATDKTAAETKAKIDKGPKEKRLKGGSEAKTTGKQSAPKPKRKRGFDLNRDTTIRYFGYAGEVGYCSRNLLSCAARYVMLLPAWSAFTFSYIVRDAYDKSSCAYIYTPPRYPQRSYLRSLFEWLGIIEKTVIPPPPSESKLRQRACIACGDALIWQGLASLLIPAFLMRNTQHYGRRMLCHMGVGRPIVRYGPTLCALALIPLLGKPIDNFVDNVCDKTYRFWFSDY